MMEKCTCKNHAKFLIYNNREYIKIITIILIFRESFIELIVYLEAIQKKKPI